VRVLRLFAIAIFLSAALLFVVQPMTGKVLLPLLGGSPSVWNTCMVFFQGVLLLGYLYAHLLSTRVPTRAQSIVHIAVMLLAGVTLAMPVSIDQPGDTEPRLWMLRALAMTIGLPFFVVSTSGPLLQRWFSRTDHERARDPYFLYAASNAGSLVGLLAYPLLIEPVLSRTQQRTAWTIGYAALAALVIAGAVAARRTLPAAAPTPVATGAPVTWLRRVLWVFLAFAPSSLMLGVTQHFTADVVAAPLLWVVPLALYLITFILAFSSRVNVRAVTWGRAAPWAVLVMLLPMLAVIRNPLLPVILAHLTGFFVLAMLCHTRLAEDRPDASRLTEFYLWLSVGGVLGGAFNAILAPTLFTTILEYPLAIILALCLRPQVAIEDAARGTAQRWVERGVALALAIGGLVLIFTIDRQTQTGTLAASGWYKSLRSTGIDDAWLTRIFRGFIPLLVCIPLLAFRGNVRFTGAVAGLFLASSAFMAAGGRQLHHERTFFGVHEVTSVQQDNWHILTHGTTQHGVQAVKGDKRLLPTMYYHPTGPIGDVILTLQRDKRFSRVGAIGLGAGALAAYAEPGVTFDFFEIDPAVVRIARDPELFTYITDAQSNPGVTINTRVADGRLGIASMPEGSFDLIVVDAFSSDAIPTHLITREAVQLYLTRLKPNGLLAFHISSRYFDLQPVLSRIGQELGLASRVRDDQSISPERAAEAKRPSVWVVLSKTPEVLGPLGDAGPRWTKLPKDDAFPLWTDDYSNVLDVFSGW